MPVSRHEFAWDNLEGALVRAKANNMGVVNLKGHIWGFVQNVPCLNYPRKICGELCESFVVRERFVEGLLYNITLYT